MLYIPEGCAHGYQTLEDATELSYLTSQLYMPQSATGFRHDDSAFAIEWPMPVACISDADRKWPDFSPSSLR
jgi:dTDP-4-dehydrorhamnose 3,5-epimerase